MVAGQERLAKQALTFGLLTGRSAQRIALRAARLIVHTEKLSLFRVIAKLQAWKPEPRISSLIAFGSKIDDLFVNFDGLPARHLGTGLVFRWIHVIIILRQAQ